MDALLKHDVSCAVKSEGKAVGALRYNGAVAETTQNNNDRRAGSRIETDLWMTVRGVDDDPQLVRGDISISGAYCRVDHRVARVGSILALEFTTSDRRHLIEVMAHVVREVRCDDLYRGEVVAGVAFGFMYYSAEQRNEMQAFLRALCRDQTDFKVDLGYAATAGNPRLPERGATVRILSLDGMLIETDWAVEPGESLQVEVTAPASGTVIRVQGEVISCRRSAHRDGTTMFGIQMRFSEATTLPRDPPSTELPSHRRRRLALTDAIEPLLQEATRPPTAEQVVVAARHLRGSLEQVGVASLLAFLEMERRSCTLTINVGPDTVVLAVREGRVVDVQAPGQRQPRLVLQGLLDQTQGEFEISFGPVTCRDKVGAATMELLIDAARLKDEDSF